MNRPGQQVASATCSSCGCSRRGRLFRCRRFFPARRFCGNRLLLRHAFLAGGFFLRRFLPGDLFSAYFLIPGCRFLPRDLLPACSFLGGFLSGYDFLSRRTLRRQLFLAHSSFLPCRFFSPDRPCRCRLLSGGTGLVSFFARSLSRGHFAIPARSKSAKLYTCCPDMEGYLRRFLTEFGYRIRAGRIPQAIPFPVSLIVTIC